MNSSEIRKNLDRIQQREQELTAEINLDKQELDSLKKQRLIMERSLRQATKLEEDFARRMKILENDLNQAISGTGGKGYRQCRRSLIPSAFLNGGNRHQRTHASREP